MKYIIYIYTKRTMTIRKPLPGTRMLLLLPKLFSHSCIVSFRSYCKLTASSLCPSDQQGRMSRWKWHVLRGSSYWSQYDSICCNASVSFNGQHNVTNREHAKSSTLTLNHNKLIWKGIHGIAKPTMNIMMRNLQRAVVEKKRIIRSKKNRVEAERLIWTCLFSAAR